MIPPPSAVTSVAAPAPNVAPVADPAPPNDESSVTVVPLRVETLTVPLSVTLAPPPVNVTTTPGARLLVSLQFVI